MDKITFEEIDRIAEQAQHMLTPELERMQHISGEGVQPYFRFLHLLAQRLGGSCIEIGTFLGVGSAHMAAAGVPTLGIDHQNNHKVSGFDFIEGDSADPATVRKVKAWVRKNGKVRLLFQDSSHCYNPSVSEWKLYRPMMAEGGVWVCDDITPAFYNPNPNPNGRPEYQDPIGKGMVQYFEGLPGEKKLYDRLHLGNQIGVIIL